MSLGLETVVRRFRSAWARAHFALGPLIRLAIPLCGVSVVAGLLEAGVLAIVAQVAFAMAQGDSSTDIALGPLQVDATVPQLLTVGLVLAALRLVAQWLLAYVGARMNAAAQARLQRKLFHAYSEAAWSVQSRDPEGHLHELVTSHARNAMQAAMAVAGAIAPLSSFTILLGAAVLLNPLIAVAVAAAAVGIFLVLRPFGRMTRRQAERHSSASLSLAEGVGEAVRLTEEMHVYGTAPQHRDQVDREVQQVENAYFRGQLLSMGVPALHQGLALILVISGLSVLYAVGSDNLGALGAIVLILVRSLSYGQQLQGAYQKLNDMTPFLDRVVAEVTRYSTSAPRSGPESVPGRPDIAFDRVSFSYDARQTVLHEVSFHVDAGETIGIVGSSGAGKSTLVQLLLRLREPDSGVYRIGSTDVRQVARSDWQCHVAYVSQEPRLLGGTVAANIRYFRDYVSDEAVETAARMAHIHDDVVSWPGGYDHRVGQRLDAVSGGQRQRLCLARALAGRPEILVLDEPTSALDPQSEAAIQESLVELHGSMTLFIVAHRMSTLSICDRIMVVESGRIGAFDTAENLQRADGYFRAAMELAGVGATGATGAMGPGRDLGAGR